MTIGIHILQAALGIHDLHAIGARLEHAAIEGLALAEGLLGELLVVDVTHDRDEILRHFRSIALQGHREPDPHNTAVLADVTLVHRIVRDLASQKLARIVEIGGKIAMMRDVLETFGKKFLAAVAGDLAEAIIDLEPGAIKCDTPHSNGGIFEGAPEAGFAIAQGILGALALRDVAAGPLVLINRSRSLRQEAIGPLLPANRAVGGQGAVAVGGNGIAWGQTRDGVANEGAFDIRNEIIDGRAFEFGRRVAEGAGIGRVHKGQGSIGTEPADHFRLVLDDRAIAGLVRRQCVLRLLALAEAARAGRSRCRPRA